MREKSPDAVREAMDDLVTGQANLLTAWRLRWRIAHDLDYAREWAKLQQLHTDMQHLALLTPHQSIRLATPSAPTFRIGRIIMQKRTALIAASVLTIFAVTGAIAERYFAPQVADCGCPGTNRESDWWYFHGAFRGRARILTPDGKLVNTIDIRGNSEKGSVSVTFSRGPRTVAKKTISGVGRSAIYGKNGTLVGYVELSPFTENDNSRISQEEREVQEDMADFIRRPERVTTSDSKRGFYHVSSLPGVVGGTSSELIHSGKVINWYPHPYAWKSYGQVHVVARLRRAAEQTTVTDTNREYRSTLEKRTLVDEAESLPIPTPDQLQQLPPEVRQQLAELPQHPVTVPETYWSVGEQHGRWVATTEHGDWKKVLRSGCFKGYGHFVVRDPVTQEIQLTLDVTPATAPDAVNALTSHKSVKDTRVVPGWSNEK